MSEEEKEAIENIKGLETLFEIDDNKDFETTPLVQKEMAKNLKILLNLIENYKKENEELKLKERSRVIGKIGDVEIHDLINRVLSNDYIPVQKIKDKIEELKSKADYYEEQAQAPFSFNFWHREFLKATHKKQALQELLESEK